MDDLLDERDITETYLFHRCGTSSYIYCLVILLLACALDFKITFVLFLACYSIGMFHSLTMLLPSALPSWMEIIIAFIFSVMVAGSLLTLWAYFIIAAIQILDDCFDQALDKKFGYSNLIFVLGVERATLLFIILFYLGLVFQPLLSVFVFSSALIISEGVGRRGFSA